MFFIRRNVILMHFKNVKKGVEWDDNTKEVGCEIMKRPLMRLWKDPFCAVRQDTMSESL